ncbi:Lds1 protein [Maudiozyma humilis]|uniref:Lds1 protein n=1 Tax=Maudiozyma humilis TaxID=51915 RepID=A0AAV5RX50_MAUHU|nr:Lds1 protein [Kazachstania humilis]
MSMATSLLLTGLGGAFHRYYASQTYEVDPCIDIPVSQYRERIFVPWLVHMRDRYLESAVNFFPGLVNNQPFVYPVRGVVELAYRRKYYRKTTGGCLAIYLVAYAVILFMHWATLAPLYIAFFAVLGPLGFILAVIHSLLQSNVLTMMFIRLSHFPSKSVNYCLELNCGDHWRGENTVTVRYYIPFGCYYFWLVHLPIKLVKMWAVSIVMIVMMGISSLPIVGPILFHLIISPFITRVYLSRMLRLKGYNDNEIAGFFATHLGAYTSFGILAGLIETIPGVAGIAVTTNMLGATLMGLETIPGMGETPSSTVVENVVSQAGPSQERDYNVNEYISPLNTVDTPSTDTAQPFTEVAVTSTSVDIHPQTVNLINLDTIPPPEHLISLDSHPVVNPAVTISGPLFSTPPSPVHDLLNSESADTFPLTPGTFDFS